MSAVREIEEETLEVKGRTVTVMHRHPSFPTEADRLLRREQIEQELYRLLSKYCREEKTGKNLQEKE